MDVPRCVRARAGSEIGRKLGAKICYNGEQRAQRRRWYSAETVRRTLVRKLSYLPRVHEDGAACAAIDSRCPSSPPESPFVTIDRHLASPPCSRFPALVSC